MNNRWAVFLLVLPHLNIYYFGLDYIQPLIYLWQSLVIIVALLLIQKHLTKFLVIIFIYIITVIISSTLHGWITFGIMFKMFSLFGLCVYISYCFKSFQELITGLFYLMSIITLVNFYTMLINGIAIDHNSNPIYLLGGKNAISITVFPMIAIIYLYSYNFYNKMKIFPFILIIICVLSIFLSDSGTGIVVAIVSTIFILFPIKLFSSFNINMIIYIFLFLSIVVFRLQEVLFGNFITNVLNKDLTFTGRTYVWDLVISSLEDSWVLGLGRGSNIISQNFSKLSETHNGILEILLDSGLIGLTLFIVILILVRNKLVATNNIYSHFLSFSIFAYMIIGLSESVFNKKEFWILLVLAYGIKHVSLKTTPIEDPLKME